MPIYPPPASEAPDPDALALGESNIPRKQINHHSLASGGLVASRMRMDFFTAKKTEQINSLRVITGSAAAGATPTLVRLGVYEITNIASSAGDLVASTANDTSLFNTTYTVWTVPLSAPWDKIAGQRYALGILVVTDFAVPTFHCLNTGAATSHTAFLLGQEPRITGISQSDTDLPAAVPLLSPHYSSIFWHLLP